MIKPHEPIKRSVITQQGQVVKQARGYCPSSQRTGTAKKSLPGKTGRAVLLGLRLHPGRSGLIQHSAFCLCSCGVTASLELPLDWWRESKAEDLP